MHYTVHSASNNHADQSARLRRLIRVFVVRFNMALAGFVTDDRISHLFTSTSASVFTSLKQFVLKDFKNTQLRHFRFSNAHSLYILLYTPRTLFFVIFQTVFNAFNFSATMVSMNP